MDFPEYLLGMLNPQKIFISQYQAKGSLVLFPQFQMWVSSKDSIDELAQIVIKGLTHYHPLFVSYTGGIFESIPRDELIESEMERFANEVYEQRPDVVYSVKATLIALAK